MAKNNYNKKSNTAKKSTRSNLYPSLVDKSISMNRQDISKMKTAQNAFRNTDNLFSWLLYNLYDYILDDALLTSQIENRI